MDTVLYCLGFLLINIDITLTASTLCGLVLVFFNKSFGKWIMLCSFLFLSLIQLTTISHWPGIFLENSVPEKSQNIQDAEGFILLGGTFSPTSTKEKIHFNLAGSRLLEFMALILEYSDKKVIFTGTPLEAEVTKQYFKKFNINESRLIIDNKARNTEDNAKNVALLLKEQQEKKWILVTSAFHMKRSILLFKKYGVHIEPYPVDYHTTPLFCLTKGGAVYWAAAIKEYMGLFHISMQKG
ncbi:MAG TPA: hypothetical protein DIC42_05670 [Holosporales bacterium]|nr:hypothetical protein [Holosporales bacterium]